MALDCSMHVTPRAYNYISRYFLLQYSKVKYFFITQMKTHLLRHDQQAV